jgi:ADP-ribose pyrophosphatase YjhB (NUDIX family)
MFDYSARYCQACGDPLRRKILVGESNERLVCERCGFLVTAGPSVLVLTLIFSQERILLIRRGTMPYKGKWAPPGGFVETGESLEAAAVREVAEEVGLPLSCEQMIPHAIVSLPKMNQVHVAFLAVLDAPIPLQPALPEVHDARWFLQQDYPTKAWQVFICRLFDRVRTGRFEFYQQRGAARDHHHSFVHYLSKTRR